MIKQLHLDFMKAELAANKTAAGTKDAVLLSILTGLTPEKVRSLQTEIDEAYQKAYHGEV